MKSTDRRSKDKYILPLQHMFKGFEKKDPPKLNNLGTHHDFPDWLWKWGHMKGSSPQQQVVGDLEMIVFYYLLRVGEYTAPKRQGWQPRTQFVLVNDVTFLKLSKTCGFLSPLPLNESKQEPFSAVVATLCITKQKNTCSRERVCTM